MSAADAHGPRSPGSMVAGLAAGGVAVLGDSGASPSPGPRADPGGRRKEPHSSGRAGPRSPRPPVAGRAAARREGFLTGPSPADPARVALRFVRRHSAALGCGPRTCAGSSRTAATAPAAPPT